MVTFRLSRVMNTATLITEHQNSLLYTEILKIDGDLTKIESTYRTQSWPPSAEISLQPWVYRMDWWCLPFRCLCFWWSRYFPSWRLLWHLIRRLWETGLVRLSLYEGNWLGSYCHSRGESTWVRLRLLTGLRKGINHQFMVRIRCKLEKKRTDT